ncbi:MAG: hypothetical protein K0U98_08160 [Deltaproteobacteria bacterium]|nr:hypothetical protein [Deltaproteobacteria bacterium]
MAPSKMAPARDRSWKGTWQLATTLIILTLALPAHPANLTQEELEEQMLSSSVPNAMWNLLRKTVGWETRPDYQHQNPFFLQGDFDGEGGTDFILRPEGEARLLIVRASGEFSWLEDCGLRGATPSSWRVHLKGDNPSNEEGSSGSTADTIEIRVGEMTGCFLSWDSEGFVKEEIVGC